ncbi:hypothetical protein SUGI_0836870 [Cryptomeria japonica]|nr:hypothetical protein SUGI_0836870 [Cryptomeria japonica]
MIKICIRLPFKHLKRRDYQMEHTTMSDTSPGITAIMRSTRRMITGTSNSIRGGGVRGGRTKGRNNNKAVRQISAQMDSTLNVEQNQIR